MPRKTTSARLRRRTFASSSTPTFEPSRERRTLVILSTMIRLGAPRPLPGSGSISSRNNGASGGSGVKGHRVHEGLVVLGGSASGHRARLPVSFGGKALGRHVWHPDLHRPQALRAQALPVRADAPARADIGHCTALSPLHVTVPRVRPSVQPACPRSGRAWPAAVSSYRAARSEWPNCPAALRRQP